MAIVNATPDSFFDGGHYPSSQSLIERCLTHMDLGADWIDIGGESTRPGAQLITEGEECDRVLPVIEATLRSKKTSTLHRHAKAGCEQDLPLELFI